MCENSHWIKNRYDGRSYYVKCGHCVPCIQQKANLRVQRIQNEWSSRSDLVCIFLLLHYNNKNVPYVRRSDWEYFKADPDRRSLFVYRNNKCIDRYEKKDFALRFNPNFTYKHDGDFVYSDDRFFCPDFSSLDIGHRYITSYRGGYHHVRDVISVLYLKDIQNFFKLLKINLVRDGYKDYFSYFYCGDYGGTEQRCHYHALIFVPFRYYSYLVSQICKSWKHSDLSKPRRQKDGSFRLSWEIARNPAKYVASYVNCVENLPSALAKLKKFKPLYKFSHGFGTDFNQFSLQTVIEHVRRGSCEYFIKQLVSGAVVTRAVVFPKYVLSRYFPRFTGFGKLFPDEVVQLALQPARIYAHARYQEVTIDIDDFIPCSPHGLTYLDLSLEQCKCIYTKLINLNRKVYALGEEMYFDWAHTYSRVWSLYMAICLRRSWDDVKDDYDIVCHFDNIADWYDCRIHSPFLDQFRQILVHHNPDVNNYNRIKLKNACLIRSYSYQKHHHSVKSNYYE